MSEWTTLVSAEELAQALGRKDLIIIDARVNLADRDASERLYRESHIPGAQHADLERDLSDMRQTGAGRHPWPTAADFALTLGRWGVTPAHQVLVYDAGDGALAAARLWFLLRAFDHSRVAVLDGGWARWKALGLPVDDQVPTSVATHYPGEFDASRLLDADAVQRHLDRGGLLIDARAAERFRGEVEPLDKAAGHVPGAVNRPYALNMADGRFKPATQLQAEFADLLESHAPSDVAVMCGSGVTACHHLLAMTHAGLPAAKLFMGSWSGWISDGRRPIATGA